MSNSTEYKKPSDVQVAQGLSNLYDAVTNISSRELITYQQILNNRSSDILEKVGPDKLTDAAALKASQLTIVDLQKRVAVRLGVNNTESAVPLFQTPVNSKS